MKDIAKVKLLQSAVTAIVITGMMTIFSFTGFGLHTWILFLPLILFFALGADIKIMPSMIICFILGIAWSYVHLALISLFTQFSNEMVVNTVPILLIIFIMLVIHDIILGKTVFGNIPALFLGMCTTAYVFANDPGFTTIHLVGFYLYGVIMTLAVVLLGKVICSAIWGKEKMISVLSENTENIS